MTLSITLSPDKEKRLRERAAAAGEDVGTFVSKLLDQFAAQPTPLEQISGPIYQAFLESGMTDDELGDLLEKGKDEMRAEKAVNSSKRAGSILAKTYARLSIARHPFSKGRKGCDGHFT